MNKCLRAALLAAALCVAISSAHAAGVTVITHGLNSNVDDWVIAMAERMPHYASFPGTNFACYEIYFAPAPGDNFTLAWRKLGGTTPTNSDSGEIFIKLDWRDLANNDYSTFEVASMALPGFLRTDFIPALGGHALAELPIHLIGHSRGGSLMSQISRMLGTNGIWIDQLTTLDPHPLNADGFDDFPYSVEDAPVRTYENVLFHDNYYQRLNAIAFGEPVSGAYIRKLENLDGGYTDLTASHSDVHLWYHGTVDLRTPADDSVAAITRDEREAWWAPQESAGAAAGYHYSRIGGGDRLASNRPAGTGTARVRTGFNQHWDLGAGVNNNRTSLPRNSGEWPNVIRLNLAGTNQMTQGESNTMSIYYQWAKPPASTGTVSIFLDDDSNPYNGNEQLIAEETIHGTGADGVNHEKISVIVGTNITAGTHTIYARITGGGRARYLFAPETLQVLPLIPVPPQILKQPLAQRVEPGTNVSFSIMTAGTPPFFFQWQKDEHALEGATNAELHLQSVTSNDIGDYNVVVSNRAGVAMSAAEHLFVALRPDRLTVNVVGDGTVTPNLDGKLLKIGKTYTVTARPAAGNLFSNWTGGIISSKPELTFTMESNLALTASFVPSPFTAVRGTFKGLFFDAASPSHENAGALSLALDARGNYRATVRHGATARTSLGAFSLDLRSHFSLALPPDLPQLDVWMLLNPSSGEITGEASNGSAVATLEAFRNRTSLVQSNSSAGNYNLLLPFGATNEAFGDGFAKLNASAAGRINARITLPDGSLLNVVTAESETGRFPIYAPLYAGRGSLFGWLAFTNDTRTDVDGTLHWIKPGSVGGKLYVEGITNSADILGSRYAVPPVGQPVIVLTNGFITFVGDELLAPVTVMVTQSGNNLFADGNLLPLTISPNSGVMSGSFVGPFEETNKRMFKALLLPKQNRGGGFFSGFEHSGRVVLENQ